MTDSDMSLDVMFEGTQRGTPCKRELGLRKGIADVVARLQKEVEDFRSESGYDCPGKTLIPPQQSGWAGFTSTSVPMFAGTTSWDQYRQVFEAIVSSNGWDDVMAALQLLSHLEGDALNVVLLVPAPRRMFSCTDRAL